MEKEILIFENPVFGQVRTYQGERDEIYFCAVDVCRALRYGNSREALRKHVEVCDITKCDIIDNMGRKQYSSFINESGLYALVFASKLPKAREFKHWVTAEVLPQIRKTGGYIPVEKEDDEKTILAKAVKILMKTVEMQKQELAEQNEEISRLAPKAEYAEEVLLSPTCYTMTEVAKSLSLTVQELQYRLHKWGFIYRAPSGCWMLYAPYLKQGYEAYRTKTGTDLYGNVDYTHTYLVWTERGKEYIHSMFNQLAA